MKHLEDYTDDKYSALLDKHGGFYAFSKSQFDAAAKPNVKYASCEGGLFAPADNAVNLVKELMELIDSGVAQDIAENGKTAIIARELINHEAYYTMDIEQTVDKLTTMGYGFTEAEIKAVFDAEVIKHYG